MASPGNGPCPLRTGAQTSPRPRNADPRGLAVLRGRVLSLENDPAKAEAWRRTIADAGLSILSAHIDGYGERAVDAFYVTGPKGEKVTDARKGNALKTALLAALNDEGGEEPRRANLQRARASVAR